MVKTDRGGQVTYHGPGQLVVYVLLDLRRAGLGVRQLVDRLEGALIALLAGEGLAGTVRPGAPGVYVAEAKIASLGLRIRNGCSYHGLALNLDLDLEPFTRINPCGFPSLAMTRLIDLGVPRARLPRLAMQLAEHIATALGISITARAHISDRCLIDKSARLDDDYRLACNPQPGSDEAI